MANVGYTRVSSKDQNTARQLQGVSLDIVFEEKVSSSKAKRPVLIECLNYLRSGDTLHIHSIDRLARSLFELQRLVKDLTIKGVTVHFHTENLTFNAAQDKPSPMQELLFQLLGAIAQFERSLIRERQLEGIEQAKKEGRYNGRPRKISDADRDDIINKLRAGTATSTLAKEYNVDRSTIQKIKRKFDKS